MYHPQVISSRRLHLVIALMLPIMMMRGLLPAGYMAVAEHGELRIAMCSGGVASPVDDHGNHAAGGPDCAFALAHAGTAPPSQHVLALLEPPPAIGLLSFTPASRPPATGPPRTMAVRGPPLLS